MTSPDVGFVFGVRSGACLGESPVCILIMDGDKSATASFIPLQNIVIDWTVFPDGASIPVETQITNQFQCLGVVFVNPPGPPVGKTALRGILISGGPTGFSVRSRCRTST